MWSSDGGPRKEAYDTMAKRFNEQFPNVTVTRIAGGADTLAKLITMMASDTRVDVVGTRPDYIAAYMEGPGLCRDMRQFVKRDSSVIKETTTWRGSCRP